MHENVEYKVESNDRKRKSSDFAESCLEKFVKSRQSNLFLADFNHLEPPLATLNSRSAAYGLNGNLIFIYQRSFKLFRLKNS